MTFHARTRRTTALAGTGLLVLTTLGTLALTEQSAQAATETLYVDWDAPSTGPNCTQALPCETLDEAIELVTDGSAYDGDAVTISIGAGDQFVNGRHVVVDPDSVDPASIAFVGAGAGTVIKPLAGYRGSLITLEVPYAVSFSNLTLRSARGADGDTFIPNAGTSGGEAAGIDSFSTGPLSVTDVLITDIEGGTGGTGNHPFDGADGGRGGHGVGVRARGDLTLTRVVISNVRGGDGTDAIVPSSDQYSYGGSGGDARAVDADFEGQDVQVISSTLTDLHGGDGGAGGEGVISGAGGNGGAAVGINEYDSDVTVTRSTINLLRGGAGGSSAYGAGSRGGYAAGLTSEGGGQSNLITSTITDLRSGNGGNGTTNGGHSGYAAGLDSYEQDSPGAVSVVSSTISSINRGTPGTGSTAGEPGDVFGVSQHGATLTLSASVLAVPGGDACNSSNAIVGAGRNVVTDDSCGTGSNKIVAGLAGTLGALAANGGPTRTIALAAGSPARNAVPAPSAVCAAPDQRGAARPNTTGKACDAGAFEAAEPAPPAPPKPPAASKATCDGLTATKVGTNGNDVITGTSGRDVIAGLGGNDTIRGLGGNDLICGGSGRDKLIGGSGNDKLRGGSGNDNLSGGSGNDRLLGEAGKDRLSGGKGKDYLRGGQGRDRVAGGPGRDNVKS